MSGGGGTFNVGEVALVIGGAGSIGSALVEALVKREDVRVVRAFDVDEYALYKLKTRVISEKLRTLHGDMMHRERLRFGMDEVDSVFALAAAKNLVITEYNIPQLIRVNLEGLTNIAELALEGRVKRIIFSSSDKAVDYSSAYGLTKTLGEKLMQWGNSVGSPRSRFSSVRFPNTIETKGNVFEAWKEQSEKGEKISLTDPEMSRFFWHIDEAVSFILDCWDFMEGGETFIPKGVKEWKMGEIAHLYASEPMTEIIGSRDNEVVRGKLWNEEEGKRLIEKERMYVLKR